MFAPRRDNEGLPMTNIVEPDASPVVPPLAVPPLAVSPLAVPPLVVPPLVVHCQDCAFWLSFGKEAGSCRRFAPPPSQHVDDTGFWPETLAVNSCGEGIVKTDPGVPGTVSCGDCAYWHRQNPDQGVIPLRRTDLPADWWRAAGFCTRHAPRAEYQSQWRTVTRAHWRATHVTDHCGEGARRVASPPGEEPG